MALFSATSRCCVGMSSFSYTIGTERPQALCVCVWGGAALTDGAGAPVRVLLQQLHDAGLLRGRAAAADHGGALAGQLHEFVLVVPQAHLEHRQVTPRACGVSVPTSQLPNRMRRAS